MAGQSDQPQPQSGSTAVPDLIERYRSRRDAWIAQADELARLRDEVRESAEREAMDIVTAARRDVRKVIVEARRELLVLSAQVQAALGEAAPKTDPTALLNKAGITPDAEGLSMLPAASGFAFVTDDAVNEILNEVQDDMTALAEDAKAIPLQAAPQVRQITAAPPPAFPSSSFTTPLQRPSALTPEVSPLAEFPQSIDASEPNDIRELSDAPEPLSDSASSVLLSSQFPSDAVPVESGRRRGTFVGAVVGIGIVAVGLTMWWLSRESVSGDSTAGAANTAPSESAIPTAPSAVAEERGDAAAPVPLSDAGRLSLVAEAVRDVWVRTTIDGRSDGGRTLSAGQVIDVSAEKTISLRAGDGGAILYSLNHTQKQALGRDGQPITRDFDTGKPEAPVPASPVPQPAKPVPPAPAASPRSAPPIASAAPAPAPPMPTSTSRPAPPMPTTTPTPVPSVAQAPPMPVPVAPPVAPPQPVNPIANNTQPAVPPAVVNQLSAPANSSAPVAVSPANVVVAIARQWLDAYHRQDQAAMAALSTDNLLLADERRPEERFPPGLADVTRALDRVSVQIAADTAVLTAVMTEQSGSQPSPHVSPISQVWVLGAGQWKVRQARFVSEARLNQVFR
jgi:hypothetical protein